jgi:hypothetical protein
MKGINSMFFCENNKRRNCNNYLFPPTGGKKPRIVANKIAKTDFLQERHKTFKNIFYKSYSILILIFLNCNTYQVLKQSDWTMDLKTFSTKSGNYTLKQFPVMSKKGAVVLFDPIFVKKENLYPTSDLSFIPSDKTYLSSYALTEEVDFPSSNRGTLIPYLNSKGFTVYLISPDTISSLSLKKSGTEVLREILTEIEKEESEIILGGLSLGGQAIAHYLSSGNKSSKIQKVFFLGTGLDYQYTGSLVSEMEKFSKKEENYICKISEKDNFCNRYVTSLRIEKSYPRRSLTYPNVIPILEKDPQIFGGFTNQNLDVLVIYGKLDGVSPEESVLAPYFKGWGKNFSLSYFEASTASNLGHDYDHFDLFYHKNSEKEIYSVLANWISKKKVQ